MVRSGNTAPLIEADGIATQAGDWLWGTLQGTLISMIPIIDQVMDLRDITANVMLLTDDDEANDTDAWLAFTLTGIGLVPVVGSAVKGVGKVILKNTGESLYTALAVLRKLGKGDPVKYLRDINWQDLGKQSATEVKNIVKGLRDSLDDMSTSWHYDLLLPDAAIEGMQATVKRLDDVTPKIDQHMQQAAQEIGQRVNKALDEYQGQSPIRGVTDKPTKAKADELEPPKGNELPGAKNNSSNNTKTKKARKISNRLKYLGKTPSKTSRTGKEVIARMRKEGKIRDKFGKTQFKDSKGNWHPLSQADMAHDPTDAVRWWNTKGRQYGAKSKEVRKWMLDPNNYTLDHYSLNRSAGAKLKETYLSPINKLKK